MNAEHQADVPVIEQFGMELDIDIGEVSRDEIRKAILRLKNGKSPGLDAITAEMLKADIETSTTMFHELFRHIWRHDTIPNDWAKGLIIKLLKKGDQSELAWYNFAVSTKQDTTESTFKQDRRCFR